MPLGSAFMTLGLLIGLSLAAFADTLTGKVVKITDGGLLIAFSSAALPPAKSESSSRLLFPVSSIPLLCVPVHGLQ